MEPNFIKVGEQWINPAQIVTAHDNGIVLSVYYERSHGVFTGPERLELIAHLDEMSLDPIEPKGEDDD